MTTATLEKAEQNGTAANSMFEDLVALQSEIPVIPFDSENPHFRSKFASLGAIMEKIRPLLAKHGFAWVTCPTVKDGVPALRYALVHRSGAQIEDTMLLQSDKATAQAQGSALSYARRYSVSAVLGLVADKDDDGNAATDAHSARGAANSGAAVGGSPAPANGHKLGDFCPMCNDEKTRLGGNALLMNCARGHKFSPTEAVGDTSEIPF